MLSAGSIIMIQLALLFPVGLKLQYRTRHRNFIEFTGALEHMVTLLIKGARIHNFDFPPKRTYIFWPPPLVNQLKRCALCHWVANCPIEVPQSHWL